MHRDMDLVRRILLQAADADADTARATPFVVEGYDERTVARYLELMHEAGLLEANLYTTEQWGPLRGYVNRITWSGYDFLDAARNDTIWGKTRALIADKGGGATFDILKELLVSVARGYFVPDAQ